MSGLWHLSQSDAPLKKIRQGCETIVVDPHQVHVNCKVGLHGRKLMRVMYMYLHYVIKKIMVNISTHEL